MNLIELIAFLLTSAAILYLMKMSPFELINGVAAIFQRRKPSFKKRILAVQKPKKPKGIRRILLEARQILKNTNQTDRFSSLSMMSMVLFLIGFAIAVSLDNIYLVPVLAIGLALLPFLYVLYSAAKYKKMLGSDLNAALSTINTSYERTENFLTAVSENLPHLNPPISNVFQRFVVRLKSIDPDIISALESMQTEIDNGIYQEWVETVIQCQRDRTLISTLRPIASKLSKVGEVASDLELDLYRPVKGFLTMLSILAGILVALCLLNSDWAGYLLVYSSGKIILAIVILLVPIALVRVISVTRPIEYKR